MQLEVSQAMRHHVDLEIGQPAGLAETLLDHEDVPTTSKERRVPVTPDHPVNRPVLQPLMLLCLTAGAGFAVSHDSEHKSALFDAAAVVSLACFAILFGLYWLGWLLREHELWRTGRQQNVE
jgi:hypothetical protein